MKSVRNAAANGKRPGCGRVSRLELANIGIAEPFNGAEADGTNQEQNRTHRYRLADVETVTSHLKILNFSNVCQPV